MRRLDLPDREADLAAVGLDVDGVMRDTGYRVYTAALKTVEELGGTPPPSFDDFVQGYQPNYDHYRDAYKVAATKERTLEVLFRHLGPSDDVAPFADVNDFLAQMRGLAVPVFAVSSHPADRLHAWFAEHGIDDHFLCIFGGSRDKRACLRNACTEVGAAPRSACYVGDWGMDMRAARDVGAIPVGITRGYPSRSGLLASGAMHVVDHLPELAALIR
jgi:phosphoglycolate phosphatase-like HAD superfamily hydrolase